MFSISPPIHLPPGGASVYSSNPVFLPPVYYLYFLALSLENTVPSITQWRVYRRSSQIREYLLVRLYLGDYNAGVGREY